jgi:hypothetical protein
MREGKKKKKSCVPFDDVEAEEEIVREEDQSVAGYCELVYNYIW